jgi:hypothetical protein
MRYPQKETAGRIVCMDVGTVSTAAQARQVYTLGCASEPADLLRSLRCPVGDCGTCLLILSDSASVSITVISSLSGGYVRHSSG